MPEVGSPLLLLPPVAQANALFVEWERRTQPSGFNYVQARPTLLLMLQKICRLLQQRPAATLDAETVRHLLADSQKFSFSQSCSSGPGRASAVLQDALAGLAPRWQAAPRLGRVLLHLSSSVLAPLQAGELEEMTEFVRPFLDEGGEIITGHHELAASSDSSLNILLLVGYSAASDRNSAQNER